MPLVLPVTPTGETQPPQTLPQGVLRGMFSLHCLPLLTWVCT